MAQRRQAGDRGVKQGEKRNFLGYYVECAVGNVQSRHARYNCPMAECNSLITRSSLAKHMYAHQARGDFGADKYPVYGVGCICKKPDCARIILNKRNWIAHKKSCDGTVQMIDGQKKLPKFVLN